MQRIIVIAWLATCVTCHAQSVATGSELLQLAAANNRISSGNFRADDAADSSYLNGFINGFATGLTWGNQICPPATVTTGQLLRVVVKHLEENPKDLHEPGALLAGRALRKSFPCKRSPVS